MPLREDIIDVEQQIKNVQEFFLVLSNVTRVKIGVKNMFSQRQTEAQQSTEKLILKGDQTRLV